MNRAGLPQVSRELDLAYNGWTPGDLKAQRRWVGLAKNCQCREEKREGEI